MKPFTTITSYTNIAVSLFVAVIALFTFTVLPTAVFAQASMEARLITLPGDKGTLTVVKWNDPEGCPNSYFIQRAPEPSFVKRETHNWTCSSLRSSGSVVLNNKVPQLANAGGTIFVRMMCDENGDGVINLSDDRQIGNTVVFRP